MEYPCFIIISVGKRRAWIFHALIVFIFYGTHGIRILRVASKTGAAINLPLGMVLFMLISYCGE